MTKRKLAIPILLILSLSILSQTLVPSPAAVDPEPWIYLDPTPIIDEAQVLTAITINVMTNYTGNIWGYDFSLTYNPLVLSGWSVDNGPVISTDNVTFTAGTFNNTIGELELTEAYSEDKTEPQPYPPLNNTNVGAGILAIVVFNVTGTGETPITLGADTKLSRTDGTTIVDGTIDFDQLGHGYFRSGPDPNHDVATTGLTFHLPITVVSTYNATTNWTYIDATIENQGDVTEMFDVKISYLQGNYPNVLTEETVTVGSASSTVVTARFNASWLLHNYGNYTHPDIYQPVGYLTIVVEASAVYDETQTGDNSYNRTLLVKMTGDVQGDPGDPDPTLGDGDVDTYDFGTFAYHYAFHYPHAKYNAECDFNRDGLINAVDFGDLAYWYGKSITAWSPPYGPL
jgi:hypothetical protein